MNKYWAALCIVSFLLLGGCSTRQPAVYLPTPASYHGVIPCADCPGIAFTLTLSPDSQFVVEQVYLEAEDGRNRHIADSGTWSFDRTAKQLSLNGTHDQKQFLVVDSSRISMLDQEGNKIESQLNHDLTLMTGSARDLDDEFGWLLGTWVYKAARQETYERWVADDTGLTGLAFHIDRGDTVVSEELQIVMRGPVVYYVAHPRQNDAPTLFALTESDSVVAVFENADHDFPKRIIYTHRQPDSMMATIEGPHADSVMRIQFGFERHR